MRKYIKNSFEVSLFEKVSALKIGELVAELLSRARGIELIEFSDEDAVEDGDGVNPDLIAVKVLNGPELAATIRVRRVATSAAILISFLSERSSMTTLLIWK